MHSRLEDFFTDKVHTCAIAGHVNPDGDCVGSTAAMYLYIKKYFPRIDAELYLERPKDSLMFLPGISDAVFEKPETKKYDLFVTCDVSNTERIGLAGDLFGEADHTLCIDHHVSNPGFADVNFIDADASSCAEVLFYLMGEERIDRDIAIALYTGIIHDSGVFQYKNTRAETLKAAAFLIEKGIPFSDIIEKSFNSRTYIQNKVLGYVLCRCELQFDGRIISGCITSEEMSSLGATRQDLDIIVSQMRLTEGVEAAVFVYQTGDEEFKVSFRSNNYLDVAAVAGRFGGGGHVRAAGCTVNGDIKYVLSAVLEAAGAELR